jgi:thioredoxin reductase
MLSKMRGIWVAGVRVVAGWASGARLGLVVQEGHLAYCKRCIYAAHDEKSRNNAPKAEGLQQKKLVYCWMGEEGEDGRLVVAGGLPYSSARCKLEQVE